MRKKTRVTLIAIAVLLPIVAAPTANAVRNVAKFLTVDDTQNAGAAIDYGYGPGVRPNTLTAKLAGTTALSVPNGGNQASTRGTFGATIPWPIIPIHEVLLPDGRVMSYGSNPDGSQTGQFYYDVWNPALGTGNNAHSVLPNTTATDIFCSGQSVMWATGETLITGGDLTVNGRRNFSNNSTTIFSPQSNSIRSGKKMQYPRWYDSIVPLPDGEMLVLGGRLNPSTPATTPEDYTSRAGWRTLSGATSADAFADATYPRGFVGPDGRVFLVVSSGNQYYLTTGGNGSIAKANGTIPASSATLPTVMFAPGKLLSIRLNQVAGVIDFNGSNPTWQQTHSIDQSRIWSSGTVLPNGKVLVIGGSSTYNSLTGAAYNTDTWDPATGNWTSGAAAAHPRLYHSNALLMPDATVLTSGGGAPGPVSNLNAEVYYPPYLYKTDGSGNAATRPTLVSAPTTTVWGKPMVLAVGNGNQISRVTFVRMGSTTHAIDLDQRFLDLPFTQSGTTLTVSMSTNWNVLLPGNWMAFVWQNGVPSIAKTVLVPS